MTVGYRSSSTSGSTPSQGTSVSTPVPAGAAAGDVALYAIFQWEATNPTVTWPTGFAQVLQVVNGNLKLKVARKRLTGADTGNYVASWTGSQFRLGQCMLITGAISTGEPVEVFDTATAVSDNDVPVTDVVTATAAFLAHFIYNDGEANFAATQTTPPTGFTEVQDNQFLHSNYRIPGAAGAHSAPGGVLSALVDAICVALIAVKPEPAGGTTVPLGKVIEVGQARGLSGSKVVTTGLVTEADSARALHPAKTVPLGRVTDVSVARPLLASKVQVLGTVAGTDVVRALGVTSGAVYTLGRVTGADVARAMSASKLVPLGRVADTQVARAVQAVKQAQLGKPVEVDVATAVAVVKALEMGRVVGSDHAVALVVMQDGSPVLQFFVIKDGVQVPATLGGVVHGSALTPIDHVEVT